MEPGSSSWRSWADEVEEEGHAAAAGLNPNATPFFGSTARSGPNFPGIDPNAEPFSPASGSYGARLSFTDSEASDGSEPDSPPPAGKGKEPAPAGGSTSVPHCCAPPTPDTSVPELPPAQEPITDDSIPGRSASDGRRHSGLVVVPRSTKLEAAERDLGLALVAVIAGTRPQVSPAMMRDYLATYLGIVDATDLEAVLYTRVPNPPFHLIWHRWRRTSLASASSFCYRVLVGMTHVPLHARSVAMAQTILGQACAWIVPAPPEVAPVDDDREFFVAAWCLHPWLISDEESIFVPEPRARVPGDALDLRADESVLHGFLGLRYRVRLRIVECQDWNTPPPSLEGGLVGGDPDDDDSDDSNFNRRHPGMDRGDDYTRGPRLRRFTNANDDAPRLGGRRETTFMPRQCITVGSVRCPLVSFERVVVGPRSLVRPPSPQTQPSLSASHTARYSADQEPVPLLLDHAEHSRTPAANISSNPLLQDFCDDAHLLGSGPTVEPQHGFLGSLLGSDLSLLEAPRSVQLTPQLAVCASPRNHQVDDTTAPSTPMADVPAVQPATVCASLGNHQGGDTSAPLPPLADAPVVQPAARTAASVASFIDSLKLPLEEPLVCTPPRARTAKNVDDD
ncbi:unnamed protein product [Miscanthus lutarioriparius]|uniref:Uncharacterized protein n=1 Tax=Miscanthus lutarioriparius TaxID=422564 RepID=A0A811SGL7_9POAL|nr:unnamed protein product [Miscanthus lutarioriparius]